MPLDPTHVRLKLLQACDQWHSSRSSTFLTGSHCNFRSNTEGTYDNWEVEAGGRLYTLGICGTHVKTEDTPQACLGERTFLCSAPLKVAAGQPAIGRDLGMWARPRQYNGELYLSSDGGNQPRDDENAEETCAPARVVFKCGYGALSSLAANLP